MRKAFSFDQLHPTLFEFTTQTSQLLEALTTNGTTDVLLGEERGRYGFTGKHRLLGEDMFGRLSVASYKDPAYMGRIITEQLGRSVEEPSGHVQFERTVNTTSVAGALYVTPLGVVAYMEIAHDDENPISSSAQECYNFANDLGLGEAWTKSLFKFRDNPANRVQEITFALGDAQIVQLNRALQTYTET